MKSLVKFWVDFGSGEVAVWRFLVFRTHREGATNAPWDCQVDVPRKLFRDDVQDKGQKTFRAFSPVTMKHSWKLNNFQLIAHPKTGCEKPPSKSQVLLRWQGEEPLNEDRLQRAVDIVIQQQPMLRACVPPDDSTDLLLGSRNSGFSTTVAATWSLLNELNLLEQWPKAGKNWGVEKVIFGGLKLQTGGRSHVFSLPKLNPT